MMHISELAQYTDRVRAAHDALPEDKRMRAQEDLAERVRKRLSTIFMEKASDGKSTLTQAVNAIEYTVVLPVVQQYCDELGISDAAVRKLVTDFALECAALTLAIESNNAHSSAMAGIEYLPVLTDPDVADIIPEPANTIEDFLRWEREVAALAALANFGEADYQRLLKIFASTRAYVRDFEDGKRPPIRGVGMDREDALLQAIDGVARKYKNKNPK